MIRTRLLWFTIGLGSASGLIAQFVFKDFLLLRNSIGNQVKEQFNALETRLTNLEHHQQQTEQTQTLPGLRE